MIKTRNRIFALVFAAMLMLSVAAPTMATETRQEENRASDYISYVYAHVDIISGYVSVYYRITGTGTMTSIGATDVMIFDSDDDCVAVLDSSNTTGLMGSNVGFYQNTVTGPAAVSGERYYAIVGFKAENSYGYDTTSYMTPLYP